MTPNTSLPFPVFSAAIDRWSNAATDNPAQYIARERYAFPGGYELAGITSDGALLCNNCCKSEYRQIRESNRDYCGLDSSDGWNVVTVDVSCNWDESQHCDHCNREIS